MTEGLVTPNRKAVENVRSNPDRNGGADVQGPSPIRSFLGLRIRNGERNDRQSTETMELTNTTMTFYVQIPPTERSSQNWIRNDERATVLFHWREPTDDR
jgi:hypothetical protein